MILSDVDSASVRRFASHERHEGAKQVACVDTWGVCVVGKTTIVE